MAVHGNANDVGKRWVAVGRICAKEKLIVFRNTYMAMHSVVQVLRDLINGLGMEILCC